MYPTNLWLFEQKSSESVLRPTPHYGQKHIGSSLPSPSGRRSTNHFHHCYSDLVSSAPIGWGFMFPEGVLGHAKGRLSPTDCQKNPASIIIIRQKKGGLCQRHRPSLAVILVDLWLILLLFFDSRALLFINRLIRGVIGVLWATTTTYRYPSFPHTRKPIWTTFLP